MKTTVYSMASIQGKIGAVKVICEVSEGIGIHLVGMPDAEVKESLLRVVTAMTANGFRIPGKKIVVYFEPDIPKKWPVKGSQLDLPLAISILVATEQVKTSGLVLPMYCFLGELSLSGEIRNFGGLSGFEIVKQGRRAFSDIVMPAGKALEAVSLFSDEVFTPKTLCEAIELLTMPDSEEHKYSFWESIEMRDFFGRLVEKTDWNR